jgi:hypothetical protein
MEDLKLLLSENPCVNYLAFIELVKVAVRNMWGNKVVFTAAYPDAKLDVTPVITHKINLREPGSVGSHREIKPRQRYTGRTDTGETYQVWGQFFDYHIQFDVWGSTGDEADKTVGELEALLAQYTGYFMKKGVVQLIFERQLNDTATKAWRAELNNRSLVYYLKLDETKVTTVGDMKVIDVNAMVQDLLNIEYSTDIVESIISDNDE